MNYVDAATAAAAAWLRGVGSRSEMDVMTLTQTQFQTPPVRAEVPAAAPRVLLADPDREVTAMLLAVMRLRAAAGMTAVRAAPASAALAAVGGCARPWSSWS